jgi:D-threo-aldose 1-dehydrogenase
VGRTAIDLPILGFGAAPLGGLYRPMPDDMARATVQAALEAGINYFDTAPFYGHGLSEHRIGQALRTAPRDRFRLSTKVGRLLRPAPRAEPSMYAETLPFAIAFDYSYEGVMRSVEDSLQRLGMDRIDILYIHDVNRRWHGDDVDRRFDEVMKGGYRALDELRSAGTVQAIGVGVNDSAILCRFARAGRFDLFMLAGRYTLLEQDPLDDILPLAIERDISIAVAAPFASGILATGARPGATYFYVEAPPAILEKARRIEAVCDRHDVRLPAAALQFPLAHPAVATVVAGFGSPAEVAENRRYFGQDIPGAFWAELKAEGLIRTDSPTPEGPTS